MLATAKPCNMRWIAELGYWLLDVPVGINRRQVLSAARWALPIQLQRYAALPPGDRKDDLKVAIQALEAGKVQQNIVGFQGNGKGDIVAFQATEKATSRLISLPSASPPSGSLIVPGR